MLCRVSLPTKASVSRKILGLFADVYSHSHSEYSSKAIQNLVESIILLDKSINNPAGNPMSKQHFMRNLAGANDNQNFSIDLLSSIYKRISQMSIRTLHRKPPDVDLRSVGSPRGVLERIGRNCRWRPAYYVHCGHILWQFNADSETTPSKFIPID